MMEELVTWMRQQFDEDAGLARMAFAEHNRAITAWSEPWSGTVEIGPDEDDLVCNDSGVSRHIVNWDPARVLAEVEAKRRILDEYAATQVALERPAPEDHPVSWLKTGRRDAFAVAVCLLAQPYAGRPGWRQEWRA